MDNNGKEVIMLDRFTKLITAVSSIRSGIDTGSDYSELITLSDCLFKVLDAKNDEALQTVIGARGDAFAIFRKQEWPRDILSLQVALAYSLNSFSMIYEKITATQFIPHTQSPRRESTSSRRNSTTPIEFLQSRNQQLMLSLLSFHLKHTNIKLSDDSLTRAASEIRHRTLDFSIPGFFKQVTPVDQFENSEHGMFLSEHLYKAAEYIHSLNQQDGQDHPTLYAFLEVYKPLHDSVIHFLTDPTRGELEKRLAPAILAQFKKADMAPALIDHIISFNNEITNPFAQALHFTACIIDPNYANEQSVREIPPIPRTEEEQSKHSSLMIREFFDRALSLAQTEVSDLELEVEQKVEFIALTKIGGLSPDLAKGFIQKLNINTETRAHIAEVLACCLAKKPSNYANSRIENHTFSLENSTGRLADECIRTIYPESSKTGTKRPMQWVKHKIIEFSNQAITPFLKLFMIVYLCLSLIAGTFLYIACGMSLLSALAYITCTVSLTLTCQFFLSKHLLKSMMHDLFDNDLFHPFDHRASSTEPVASEALNTKAKGVSSKGIVHYIKLPITSITAQLGF